MKSQQKNPSSQKWDNFPQEPGREQHFADTRFVAVYRIDRRTANVWGEWSSYPADKGTASINYDATLQGKSPVRETFYIRLRSLPLFPSSSSSPIPPPCLLPPSSSLLLPPLVSDTHGCPSPMTLLPSGKAKGVLRNYKFYR